MDSVFRLTIGLFVVCCFSVPQSAIAQRFTSSGPSEIGHRADTSSGKNGELAYEALKAGNLVDARAYLDDANPESPYAMFVRAALTRDAVSAADIYKEIVAENEGKPVAREALLQLYRYHYAAGDYAAAHQDYIELQKFPFPPSVPDPLGLRDSVQDSPSVQAPVTTPEVSGTEDAATPASPTVYLVQVGIFTTADNARKFIQQLRIYGVNGQLFTKDIGGRTLYGVSAGSFSSRDAAEDMAANLKGRSVNSIVVER